jgi:hypothetical protein
VNRFGLILIFIVLACVYCGAEHKPNDHKFSDHKLSEAERVLFVAQKQAALQHKRIFLIFGSSWGLPCVQLEKFLETPANRSVIDKYFIVTRLNVAEQYGGNPKLNTPGGDKLFASFGGQADRVPFVVLLDEKASPIITSNRPIGDNKVDNIAYPDRPEEILWFMAMLKRAAPSLSGDEAQVMGTWLRQSSRHR